MTPSPGPRRLTVSEQDHGARLDRFLQHCLPKVSRGAIRRLLEGAAVLVNGEPGRKGTRLRRGDAVELRVAAESEHPLPQPELYVEVIAVRPGFVVVSKPPQMASHPLLPGETGTAANAIVGRFPECAAASPRAREGGLVHRLDRCTSGLLVAARTREGYDELRELFRRGAVHKEYWALVDGPVGEEGVVRLPLEPAPGDRRLVRPAGHGAPRALAAETGYAPLAVLGARTLLRVWTRTGRRHQVRAHLAAIGFPLLGDLDYGGPAHPGVEGAFLHARALSFRGERFTAELPAERAAVLRALGWVGEAGCQLPTG